MKKNHILSIIIFALVTLFSFSFVYADEVKKGEVTITGTENYDYVREVFEYVNTERTNAGVGTLVLDPELTELAMQRAAETAVYWDHERPDGTSCGTISNRLRGENIAAGHAKPYNVMYGYDSEDEEHKSGWMYSPGHKANILRSYFTSIGIGYINVNGTNYWVQIFGTNTVSGTIPTGTKEASNTVVVAENRLVLYERTLNYPLDTPIELDANASNDLTTKYSIFTNNKPGLVNQGWTRISYFLTSDIAFTSDDETIAKVTSNGEIIPLKRGTTKINMAIGDIKYTYNLTVNSDVVEKPIIGVSLDKTTVNLEIGNTSKLNATINPTDTTDDSTLTWTSSNPSVATVDQNGNINALAVGTTTITVKTTNDKSATAEVNVSKKKITINNVVINNKNYDGTNTASVNQVSFNGLINNETLVLGTDYNIVATFINTNAGNNKDVNITITMLNNSKTNKYNLSTNTYTAKANINALTISSSDISIANESFIYNGNEIKPNVTVIVNRNTLIENQDYKLTYQKNINAGTANIVVEGIGNYKGVNNILFIINRKEIIPTVNDISNVIYNGTAQEPNVEVKYESITLQKDIDYTVTYTSNTNVGTANILIKSISTSNYSFTDINKTFDIGKSTITNSDVILEKSSVKYDGTAKTIPFRITKNGITLTTNDYEVEYESNIEIGPATLTIKGIGNYTGTVSKTFNITEKDIQELSFDNNRVTKTYADSDFTISVNHLVGDGTITYKSSNEGVATVDNNGKVTIKKSGEAIITALASETAEYKSDETSYTLIINKKESMIPEEATTLKSILNGSKLGLVKLTTLGLNWIDTDTIIEKGTNKYQATYTENNDPENYTTRTLDINVKGLVTVNINTKVDGKNGTITSSKEDVLEGTIVPITFTPEEGYEVSKVTVNNEEVDIENNLLNLIVPDTDVNIVVTYDLIKYEVTFTGIENVELNTESNLELDYNSSKEFNIKAKKGYKIKSVTVNGKEVELNNDKLLIENIKSDTTIEITTEEIIYEVIDGANQTYTKTKDSDATFRINAEYSLLESVYVDGELIDSSKYTSKEGSTIISLNKEYLDSLNIGQHTIKITFTDGGKATTLFNIKEVEKSASPRTSDNIITYMIVLTLSIISLSTTLLFRKKLN